MELTILLARLLAAYPPLASLIPRVREAFSESILGLFSILLAVSVLTVLAALFIENRQQSASKVVVGTERT